MDNILLKRPFLKSKNFDPAPVVRHGVPAFADSILNRKVIDTPAWREWWNEQLYYIINGYTTAGVFIPGRYYYYLNFCKTSSVKGGGSFYPEYIDFQYEYFLLVEEAKRLGMNIIAPKGRRKGVSVMSTAIIDYGYRFLPDNKAGIAAGKKEYAEDFLEKWIFLDSLVVPEFRTRKLSDNYDDIISGWSEKNDDGFWNQQGTMNKLYCRTMFSDPEVFKGKYLNDVVFEEAGEFDNLVKTLQATKACLMDGNIQYGNAYIYGTGGNIRTGSKGFEEVWHNYKDYNCLRYFIDGPKFYRPHVVGTTNKEGTIIDDTPNLLQYADYQRVGMEDEVRAKEVIDKRKSELRKTDLKAYWEYCKDNPTDIKEVFRKAASNNFPIDVLNDQGYEILSQDKRYSRYILDFKKNKEGITIVPYEIDVRVAGENEAEDECVLILNTGHPMKGYRNLYCAGIDSYDQDQAMTTSSLGGMVVLMRDHSLPNIERMVPACMIRCRPKRKEKFYDMCLAVSVYYDLKYNTLIDFAKPGIIKHYKDRGAHIYLAKRPEKFESEKSEQRHDYGVLLTSHSKPLMLGMLQTYFLDHGHKLWFPILIDEALSYDETARGEDSDKDAVDALGIALMQMASYQMGVINENEMGASNPYAYPEYGDNGQGGIMETSKIDYKMLKMGTDGSDEQMWARKCELEMLHEEWRSQQEKEDEHE